MRPVRQLALTFPHTPHYHADDFCAAASNEAAVSWLDHPASWPGGRLAIYGEEGLGKTHLLHRWAHRQRAELIQGSALRGLVAPPGRGAAVDDADEVVDEPALLHLANALQEAGLPLLLAGRGPPAHWPVRLADLASRMRAMTAVPLGQPEDGLLRALFTRLLSDRQLMVPESVQDWLRMRLPRSAAALREAACRLDHAAMRAGRQVSRSLAATIIADMQGMESDDVLRSARTGISPTASNLF